jgi:hypothetical protein
MIAEDCPQNEIMQPLVLLRPAGGGLCQSLGALALRLGVYALATWGLNCAASHSLLSSTGHTVRHSCTTRLGRSPKPEPQAGARG